MGRVVVGVDGSANSVAALRWAVAEAELRRDRVTAVFAWGYIPPGHAGDGRTLDAEYGAAEADSTLAAAIEGAVAPGVAGSVERRVMSELAPEALLAAAAGSDLLAIGARGVGGFRGLLLGSVSQACLHHTTVPLAIIRSAEPAGGATEADRAFRDAAGGRIVVGVDGSDSARRALRWALEEARLRVASLDVVHAWRGPYVAPSPFAGVPLDIEIVEKNARSVLDRAVDGEDTRRQPAAVERILVQGGAAHVVLDTARGADLVVLGTRGLGGFTGLLLGSVTHHVAHHIRCPMVVIP
jgi:nucleotide-binding universal stress UspA family protein